MPTDTTSTAPVAGAAAHSKARLLWITLFIFTLVLPVSVDVATLRLTPNRIFLLLAFVPTFVLIVSGKSGRFRLADLMILFYGLWMFFTLLYHEGFGRFPYAGISAVQAIGGYLLGRVLIRTKADFKRMVQAHLITLMFLFPFAIVETLTGQQYLARFLDVIGDVYYRGESSRPRWGLDRVITGFEHPILFGLYCSIAVATSYYIFRNRIVGATIRAVFALCMTFMSLSSGPLLAAMAQIIMISWDIITRGAWKLFLGLFTFCFVFLSIFSNRGPIIILIETLTFNAGNAWTRVHTWNYASAEVMRNPIFGLGLERNWARPSWLVGSIDNFWLLTAFLHGIPAVVFLGTGVLLIALRSAFATTSDLELKRYRTGYIVGLTSICIVLATVHIWSAISVFVMFYFGAGAWIEDQAKASDGDDTGEAIKDHPEPATRYSRFEPSSGRHRPV